MDNRFAPPWDQTAWEAASAAWIRTQLENLGQKLTGPIESVHWRPWSTVLRVPTDQGDAYFKAGGPTQSFEPALLRILQRQPNASLPLLAADEALGWSLLPDGGQTLRQVVNGKADIPAWSQILGQYARLQIAAAEWSAELQATGLPFRDFDYLRQMYSHILQDEEIRLVGGDEDELSAEQLQTLIQMEPSVSDKLEQLEAFGLPLSLEHGDLHDANIFAGAEGYRLYDWGDATYTHPFFTLLLPIRHMASKLGCSEYDAHPDLMRLRDAYLQPWAEGRPMDELVAVWDLAHYLAKYVRTITWYRVYTLTTPEMADDCRLSVAGWFQEFLADPST